MKAQAASLDLTPAFAALILIINANYLYSASCYLTNCSSTSDSSGMPCANQPLVSSTRLTWATLNMSCPCPSHRRSWTRCAQHHEGSGSQLALYTCFSCSYFSHQYKTTCGQKVSLSLLSCSGMLGTGLQGQCMYFLHRNHADYPFTSYRL